MTVYIINVCEELTACCLCFHWFDNMASLLGLRKRKPEDQLSFLIYLLGALTVLIEMHGS